MTQTYTILDLETTGLDHIKDRITEIAAMRIREDGKILGTFHTMVKLPGGQKVPEFIVKLTGITDADLVGGMDQAQALASLKKFVQDSIVIAQHAPFDLGFISKGNIYPQQFIDTRTLSRLVDPEERRHGLKDICARYDIDLTGHHRAMADVEATATAFMTLQAQADEKGIQYKNILIETPDRPLQFKPKTAYIITL